MGVWCGGEEGQGSAVLLLVGGLGGIEGVEHLVVMVAGPSHMAYGNVDVVNNGPNEKRAKVSYSRL